VNFREDIEAELASRRVGLTFSQVSTLSILSANPGINGAQLARRNMVTPQAMTGVLRELSSRGLLVKSAHPDNLRADSWHVTGKGETQLQRGRAVFAEITARMLDALGKADIGKLEGYLTQCARSLAAPRLDKR
jgi:DNA-binding MarR family transcriptional regulator